MNKKLLYYFVSILSCIPVACFAEQLDVQGTFNKHYIVKTPVIETPISKSALVGDGPFSEKLLKPKQKFYAINTHKGEINIKPQKVLAASSFDQAMSQATKEGSHQAEVSLHLSPYVIPYASFKNFSWDQDKYGVVFGNFPKIPMHIIIGKFSVPFGWDASEGIESNYLETLSCTPTFYAGALNFAIALRHDLTSRISIFTFQKSNKVDLKEPKNRLFLTRWGQDAAAAAQNNYPWGGNVQFDFKNLASTAVTCGFSYITDNPADAVKIDYPIKEAINAYLRLKQGAFQIQGEWIRTLQLLFDPSRGVPGDPKQVGHVECAIDLFKVIQVPCTLVGGWSTSNITSFIINVPWVHQYSAALKWKLKDYTGGLIDTATVSHKWYNSNNPEADSQSMTTVQFTIDLLGK